MTERQISKEIIKFLRKIGCAVWDLGQGYRGERGGTRQTPGLPDLFVVHPSGVWTWAELKTAKGKLRPSQEVFRDTCIEAEIPWALWRSVEDSWEWCVEVGLIEEAA